MCPSVYSTQSFWSFGKILRNGSLKRFGVNDFGVNCDSQQRTPKRPPQKHENKPPTRKTFKHIKVVYFFHAESNGGIHCTISIEIKELELIFRTRVVTISPAQCHPVAKIISSRNFVNLYTCSGSPITTKMMTYFFQ